MNRNTHIANALIAADDKSMYDAQAKQLLSNKQVLAWIMKYSVEEFKGMSIAEIIPCIEGTPEIGIVPVYPGQQEPEAIQGGRNEDTVPNEGTITYDIRFHAITPTKERVKIILNVEAQKDYWPGYDIVTRAIFYCARMLSSQMDTEFTGKDYDGIKKVYSIWICMDCPEYAANTITEYKIVPHAIYGNFQGKARYDLMSAVLVCLAKDGNEGERSRLHDMLGTLLSSTLSVNEKLSSLNKDFNLQTKQLEAEVSDMCNLSERIEERGIQQGKEIGEERFARLCSYLLDAERTDDCKKATVDLKYREELFKEFGL